MKVRDNYLIEEYRTELIREIAKEEHNIFVRKKFAEELFEVGLTVYSDNYTIESAIYNAFSESVLDENIFLHPEQHKIINMLLDNEAIIISAPTSFGKTFCVFEYIGRFTPNIIVMVVPTLALCDEYRKKIINKYKNHFKKYSVYTSIDSERDYDLDIPSIFILTHDKVVNCDIKKTLCVIDFLVIDEIYKLETNDEERTLILNIAYYELSKIAKKYVLLAPFVKEIINIDVLEKKPIFYSTNYSPVVNDVIIEEIVEDSFDNRIKKLFELENKLPEIEKTLIYFPTVTKIYKFINRLVEKKEIKEFQNDRINRFIKWAKESIHEEWSFVLAIERGYLIHNAQIPIGAKTFNLDFFENNDEINRMLCTSTLLEGVNTVSENIIIFEPKRNKDILSAFDFYNLVGRTGRLSKHYLGNAYYIKSEKDIHYTKGEAQISIEFEVTTNSADILLQRGEINEEINLRLSRMNLSYEQYIENFKSFRLSKIEKLYKHYYKYIDDLKKEINYIICYSQDKTPPGRRNLINILVTIIEANDKDEHKRKGNYQKAAIISEILNKQRLSLKSIINRTIKAKLKSNQKDNKKIDCLSLSEINRIIGLVISLKSSFVEFDFYRGLLVIIYFMERDFAKDEIAVINEKILNPIEYRYYFGDEQRRMLYDIGVIEKDIEIIIKALKRLNLKFNDTREMITILNKNLSEFKNISFISKDLIEMLNS